MIKWFFHIWLVFVTWGMGRGGVKFKQYSINIFRLTNKITIKTYDIITQKCNSAANLKSSNLVWAVLKNVPLSETVI